MELQTLQSIAIFTSLGFMFAQLLVRNKQMSHVLFAIFCGSVAMSLAKDMSGNALGVYQYLIGMGACATCNGYWLLARSLFRGKNSISIHHLLLAAAIAMLIMINQGYLFASHIQLVDASANHPAQYLLRELTVLLSSCILVLSFWEGCRGFTRASQKEKAQRMLFLTSFGAAVVFSKVAQGIFAGDPVAQNMSITFIILYVLLSTQVLMLWRFTSSPSAGDSVPKNEQIKAQVSCAAESPSADEALLAGQVKALIFDQCLFLQPNLKIADIAQKLNVPEYRVSNVLRHNLNARNFNQYVNALRIKHAQALLADSDKRKWPVLVVGLESGFASVGPFTRAFKVMTGYTPNQYRQKFNH